VANDYVVSVNCDEQDDSKQKTTILIKKHASNTISHQNEQEKNSFRLNHLYLLPIKLTLITSDHALHNSRLMEKTTSKNTKSELENRKELQSALSLHIYIYSAG